MLQALRRRLERDEEGFTLIELMVVVLIIAILLAIAIPTFLGARTKAQDRAAQSNLRNAFTAEKTIYVDNQLYVDDALPLPAGQLTAVEPSLKYQVAGVPVTGIIAVTATGQSVLLATKSPSGTCFYLQDNATAVGAVAAGTTYAHDTACLATTAATFGPSF
jgi:type IV pilus assembly protein PilA